MTEKVIAYSAKTRGFYPIELKSSYEASGCWPDDAVFITKDDHQNLLDGQGQGKTIDALECGTPYLRDGGYKPTGQKKTEMDTAHQKKLIEFAKKEIGVFQVEMYLGTISDDEKSLALEWVHHLKGLRALNINTEEEIVWPVPPQALT